MGELKMRSVEDKLAFKRRLENRTSDFAVAVFRMLDALPLAVSSKVIAFQLGKSASSVGANYREANRAESPDDFNHKIGIVLKECAESLYWLEMLHRLYAEDCVSQDLLKECDELVRIFQTIRRRIHDKRKASNEL